MTTNSTNVTYLKGIRTRYRNYLEKEIENGTGMLRVDPQEIDIDIAMIEKCIEKIECYSEKVEIHMEKLSSVLEENESEFLDSVLCQDSQICADAMECRIDLKQLKAKLIESQETANGVSKIEEKSDTEKLTDMQSIILSQMKQQQEFIEQQQYKMKEQEKKKEKEKASSVKLPKIDIVSYSGDRLRWNEFWDSFECTVNKNTDLSNIEKFSYLRSKLSGEAARAVSGLALSNENYDIAITVLRERFGNNQEVIDLHYNEMINLQSASNTTQSLRLLLDKVQRHLRSLEVLKQNINQDVFVSMVKAKLPQEVLLQLEIMNGANNKWSTMKLIEKLRDYIVAREKSEIKTNPTESNPTESNARTLGLKNKPTYNHDRNRGNKKPDFQVKGKKCESPQVASAEALVTNAKQIAVKNYFDKCRFCEKKHWSDECPTYRTVKERKQQLKDSCFKCLKTGHLAKDCKRNKVCAHCGEANAHHRSLCPKKFKQSNSVIPSPEVNALTEQSTSGNENALISSGEFVLMQTAKTEIRNPENNKSEIVRLLLDSGSQRTYITENLAEKLKLKKTGEQEIKLATFGTDTPKVIETASTEISIKLNNGNYLNLSANIVPTISGTIQRKSIRLSMENLEHLVKSVELADSIPSENESCTIELLIGNDFYLDLVMSQRIEIHPGLYLLGSKLGWILTGRTNEDAFGTCESNLLILTYGNNVSKTAVFASVDKVLPTKPDLEDFWNVEGIGITDSPTSDDDERALQQFNDTLKYEDGRYQVTWPWKETNPELPMNRELAVGRLKSVVSKLKNKPELLQMYNSVLKDQLKKGVIEKLENTGGRTLKHYLPHHAVFNPTKSTTKLRIVYDASAKTKTDNKSLNECLYRGPVLLRNLCGILMRFRLYKTAMVADIEKAFLQIGLQPNQRDVTRFLWLKDVGSPKADHENIQEYRFCRVPFGVVSSPFLLGATLETHLTSHNSELANKLKDDIYVDNVVSGTDSVGEALTFYNGAKAIFADASMNLREWASNSDEVRMFIPSADKSENETMKVLGHIWNIVNDSLSLKSINVPTETQNLTKRSVLKTVASVFDPQGLFSPVILRGKVLLQTLWSKGLNWDDKISHEDSVQWLNIQSDIEKISEYQVPRCVKMKNVSDMKYMLLCFCDASTSAYAALVYLHQTNGHESKVDLLFTKSRLTPIKGMTVPRAELMAVLIGVRCLEFVRSQLKLPIENVYMWTDSQCVLKWISNDKDLTVFVKNRICEIKSYNGITYHFVSTKENPADIATRGCTLQSLSNDELWWHGPQWLVKERGEWPELELRSNKQTDSDYESEVRKTKQTKETSSFLSSGITSEVILGVSAPFEIDYMKYSSVTKLLRVTAYALRFIRKLKKNPSKNECLTSEELQDTERMWLRFIQRKHYAETFQAVSAKTKTNLQKQLGLYVDNQGLLRCKGRLDNSDLSEGARRPVLLPDKEHFTHLMIEKTHKQSCHSGVSQTLSQIRYRFLIPHGRATVRKVIGKCVICRRYEGGPYKLPPMSQLPSSRVTESSPFSRSGLDYLGPLFIKAADGARKVWVCLYTCLVTRAVHLELVQDMTTEEFLLCMRRFISQRGSPNEIISDNALQFKSANQTLDFIWRKVIRCEEVQNYASEIGIKWSFIVELAPWMGGFYERLVGLTKKALRKTLGRKLLTLIQRQTLLKEVEAILNSRPLVYVGEDLNSSITLTPAHFLSLNPKIGIPEIETYNKDKDYNPYESTATKLLEKWKKGQKLLNQFWKIWHDDYLLSLRERMQSEIKCGRIQSAASPNVGDVVLVKDSIPRGCWKLAKVVSVSSSRDGQTRSAKVQLTSGRVLGRPLNLLFPLEVSETSAREQTDVTPSENAQVKQRPKRSTVEKTMQRIRQSLHC